MLLSSYAFFAGVVATFAVRAGAAVVLTCLVVRDAVTTAMTILRYAATCETADAVQNAKGRSWKAIALFAMLSRRQPFG
jgi:uncharacterized membrane-anchored protein